MRPATVEEVARVRRLLAAHGIAVSEASLRRRIEEDHGGIVVATDACASWALDGGVLHVYDVVGDGAALMPVVAELDRIAGASFAAVLCAKLRESDPRLERLVAAGFERDSEENDVHGGVRVRVVTLTRAVSHGIGVTADDLPLQR